MSEFAFDRLADKYDATFTKTALGIMQRKVVWNYLEKILAEKAHPSSVLELNCGTGEDAIFLYNKGHCIVATDFSLEMLRLAREKASDAHIDDIEFMHLDIRHADQLEPGNRFDLIFSNFGGYNCLNEEDIQCSAMNLKEYLSREGIIILVLMPDRCLIEKIYGLIKGDSQLLGRRNRSPQKVTIDEEEILTWYHAPDRMKELFAKSGYEMIYCSPVGFIPSYFNPNIRKWPLVFCFIKFLDRLTTKMGLLPRYSDHYLICFSHDKN